MNFILNEFTIIMFAGFFLILILASLIAVRFYSHLLLKPHEYNGKLAPDVFDVNYIGQFGTKDESSMILKNKINHFDINAV